MTDDIPKLNLTRERDSSADDVFSFDREGGDERDEPETETPADADALDTEMDELLPDSADTDEEEVEPVELLVQLAKEGRIDPWDIDIVEVTDAFLTRLDSMDLRTTGRALFYASVLLRMKSDELLAPDDPDEDELEPWELAMQGGADEGHPGDDVPGFDPIAQLEDEMDRRLERKNARGSPKTLDELVRDLRDAERGTWWKDSREYDTSRSPRGFSRGTQTLDYHAAGDMRGAGEPTENDVTGTAHDEHIEDVVEEVGSVLNTHYENGRDEVLFVEIRDVADTVMTTYLALLFLAHRSFVRLQQDEIFGDLWIQDPEAVAEEDERDDADEPNDERANELEAEAVADD
ncbi:segregation/condensation protein A [Haloferax sp. DFSO60]|uniref:segregation/condensation protein A n=1 Tax=Haloferax sp. DFSO60 TaxID=3388652 RepID=UPI003979ACC2